MIIVNQNKHFRADVSMIDGKPVLRLFDALGVLRAQMDADPVTWVTIAPDGKVQVIAYQVQDYGLTLFDENGKPIPSKPQPVVIKTERQWRTLATRIFGTSDQPKCR